MSKKTLDREKSKEFAEAIIHKYTAYGCVAGLLVKILSKITNPELMQVITLKLQQLHSGWQLQNF